MRTKYYQSDYTDEQWTTIMEEYGLDDDITLIFDLEGEDWDDYEDDNYSDVEADADTLSSAGWGTDEDYGYYGGDEF